MQSERRTSNTSNKSSKFRKISRTENDILRKMSNVSKMTDIMQSDVPIPEKRMRDSRLRLSRMITSLFSKGSNIEDPHKDEIELFT
jgi:hypothetical protein